MVMSCVLFVRNDDDYTIGYLFQSPDFSIRDSILREIRVVHSDSPETEWTFGCRSTDGTIYTLDQYDPITQIIIAKHADASEEHVMSLVNMKFSGEIGVELDQILELLRSEQTEELDNKTSIKRQRGPRRIGRVRNR